jgi:hypothetical protein
MARQKKSNFMTSLNELTWLDANHCFVYISLWVAILKPDMKGRVYRITYPSRSTLLPWRRKQQNSPKHLCPLPIYSVSLSIKNSFSTPGVLFVTRLSWQRLLRRNNNNNNNINNNEYTAYTVQIASGKWYGGKCGPHLYIIIVSRKHQNWARWVL